MDHFDDIPDLPDVDELISRRNDGQGDHQWDAKTVMLQRGLSRMHHDSGPRLNALYDQLTTNGITRFSLGAGLSSLIERGHIMDNLVSPMKVIITDPELCLDDTVRQGLWDNLSFRHPSIGERPESPTPDHNMIQKSPETAPPQRTPELRRGLQRR